MFLKLLNQKRPMDIVEELEISRAGLQKYLEFLLEVGLLVRRGSGRNTQYLPTEISHFVLQHVERLGDLLETQQEVLKLEDMLSAVEGVPVEIGDTTRSEFVNSLNEQLEKRTKKLHTSLESVRSIFTNK